MTVAGSRLAITWKMADGKRDATVRSAAKGYRGPDSKAGPVGTSGGAGLRSSHVRAVSLSAPGKWKLWGLDIKNMRLQQDVVLRAPREWGSHGANRVCLSSGHAYGLDDVPSAFYQTLHGYLLRARESLAIAGLKFRASAVGSCLYFVYGAHEGAIGP